MTDPERRKPERQLSTEQLQALITEMVNWVEKIINEKADPKDPMTGRAHLFDDETQIEGFVTVGDLVNGYIVEYREHHLNDEQKDTATVFSIEYGRDEDFILTTTGEQPDVTENLLAQDVDEDTFANAVRASQELQEDSERFATADETVQLHTILELAAFGDEKFDFDTFQWQFEDAIDDRDAMKEDLKRIEEHNKNNPE